jgi:hypothetical protein
MEFIILFGALMVGVLLGWEAREKWAIRQVHRLLADGEIQLNRVEDEEEEERTKMRVEKHSDLLYAFTVEDDSFIAQGKDLFELDAAIQARFPGKKFLIQEDNLKEIGISHESV